MKQKRTLLSKDTERTIKIQALSLENTKHEIKVQALVGKYCKR